MTYFGRIMGPGTRVPERVGFAKPEPMSRWVLALLLFTLFLELAVFVSSAASQEEPSAKNVLVLNSFTDRSSFIELEPLEASVRARLSMPVNFSVEYLESTRFGDEDYRRDVSEALRHAYSTPKTDLIVVVSYPALWFVLDYRERMFAGVPIVFCSVDPGRIAGHKNWLGVTGVTSTVDIRGSLNLALRSHPGTQNVVILSGVSDFENYWLNQFRNEVLLNRKNLQLIEVVGLPPRVALDHISTLPAHTIVFAQIAPQDSADSDLKTVDLLGAIGQRFPTYSIFNYCFDRGCVGGSYPDQVEDGKRAGEIAARVLSGEKPENIPVQAGTATRPMVDWRQLHHWNIPESALPPGTVVLYREATLWERGWEYFLAAIAVIVVQALLIFALFWQRARKRKAEAVLRESDNRFRVMADSTPSLIWMCDEQGKVTYLNEQWVVFTGSDKSARHGDTWAASIHPDDLPKASDLLSKALRSHKPFSNECRLRRQDGVYRWMFGVASPRVNGDGSFAGFIGSAVDVTDQKIAREVLEKVSGQLIHAQEKERRRLARELHDDICQKLAMLSLKIEKVSKGWGRGQMSVTDQLEQIWQQCSNLTGDVQALSHELHPSILDNLGLATAVKSFCREVSEQSAVVVEFVGKNIPDSLPREVALSLFRVVQEGVRNAIKHSGQRHFEVRIEGTSSELELEVSDEGVGFDAANRNNGGGLGLVSMAERIHQVNGTFTIDSQPNAGTRIHACVPLRTLSTALAAVN
jgi:PAS domain S-box-containing protein